MLAVLIGLLANAYFPILSDADILTSVSLPAFANAYYPIFSDADILTSVSSSAFSNAYDPTDPVLAAMLLIPLFLNAESPIESLTRSSLNSILCRPVQLANADTPIFWSLVP